MDDLLKRHSRFIGSDALLRKPLFVCEGKLDCTQWVAKNYCFYLLLRHLCKTDITYIYIYIYLLGPGITKNSLFMGNNLFLAKEHVLWIDIPRFFY